MKKMLLVILIALVSKAAFSTSYDIKCLNQKGKFSDCKVTINSSQLAIEYKSKKEKEFNVKIPKDNIKVLSAGEYSRRRVAEAVFFSPWLLFSKKTRDHIGIEYVDENNSPKATMFEIHKKYGMGLKTELRALSGKVIEEK